MRFKTVRKKILRYLGRKLSTPIINVLCNTLNVEEINKSSINKLVEENQNMVFAFWHGTMIAPWFTLRELHPATIISKSKDGDILANLLTKWNYNVRRGSSSKGGREALENLIAEARNKKSIAITPDGPRGPEKIMKAGAVVIAKKTQIPLVLIGAFYKRKIKLKSWDKLEIPFLFTKTILVYSDPIYIHNYLSHSEINNLLNEFSSKLTRMQKDAEIV